jgi:uncharacterized DUF497 family protein
MDGYEWDFAKAAANLKKHKVDFADAALSLADPNALTVPDPDASGEERFVCLAADAEGRLLVTRRPSNPPPRIAHRKQYAYRANTVRIISSRKASRAERRRYEDSDA